MSSEVAPIGISVYTRVDHFRQCIEALKKNPLASESELFIYSDASSNINDEPLVGKVRNYARSIRGFKRVCVIERESSYGGARNFNCAHDDLTKEYGKSIFLEDDVITAPGFLGFMNGALEYYSHDRKIFSVSGYCPPITLPDNYNNDVFVLPRYCAWGVGIWRDRLEVSSENITKDEFFNIKNKKQVFSIAGDDLLGMIYKEVAGEIDAQDVRNMYYQVLNDKYTVYPAVSLVQNIGHDGSGVHCGASERFHHKKLWDKVDGFSFEKVVQLDKRIIKQNCTFRRLSFRNKAVNYTRKIGIYSLLRKIKNML